MPDFLPARDDENIAFLPIDDVRERSIEELPHGNVQSNKPRDRVVGLIAMVMPGPGRGDNEITLVHDGTLAVNRRVRAGALQHEAQCTLRMPMRGRDLAG